MKRLRVQDARQLLNRAQIVSRGKTDELLERSPAKALATRVAKSGCERVLGEWLTSAILQRLAGISAQPKLIESEEELHLELFELPETEPRITEVTSDDEDEDEDEQPSRPTSSAPAPSVPLAPGSAPYGR